MDAYRLAIEQARKELTEAQQKLKVITLRVSQLESLVTQLEALTLANAEPASPSLFSQDTVAPTVSAAAKPVTVLQTEAQPSLWKAIINALNGKKGDFTVPEAIAALERTGRHIASPNRVNIVRNTVIQNQKAFGKLSTGHYFVRGYEKEVPSEEKTS